MKDINTTRQVYKIKAVGLIDPERKKRSKKSVEPHPHFVRAVFLSGGTKKTDIVRPAGTIRKKQTAKVVTSLNEREETAAMGLKRIGEEKGDIATDEEEGFKEVGDLYPEVSGETQSDPATPSQQARPGNTRNLVIITEEGADLEGAIPSVADLQIVQVYGDRVHQNDGCQMNRGIADDDVWQMRWRLLVIQPGLRYRAPQGAVGRRFIKFLMEEFRGVRERLWNVERPMVFMGRS